MSEHRNEPVLLSYAPSDQVWAEWLEHLLLAAGVRVFDPLAGTGMVDGSQFAPTITLKIVSGLNAAAASPVPTIGAPRDPLVVYVTDLGPLPNVPAANAVTVAGLSADEAARRVLTLIGSTGSAENGLAETGSAASVVASVGPRFPGKDTNVFNAPARNVRFTGRESDLRVLRSHLRRGISVGSTVALLGMGGVGKTQVAMEYVHRFRSAYDVVYWINANPFTFIDSQLIDLAGMLGIPLLPMGLDTTRSLLTALGRGEPTPRWLLVFDSAEDPRVVDFLPHGPGHTLITSRDPVWSDRATTMHIDVFERAESVALLNKRNPDLRVAEANRVADVLGDLPIAVAAAGAWLADTGAPVEQYLREIERHGPVALALEGSPGISVEATWSLSLQRLRERSPLAYRLLRLCSVLAPEIALDLVLGDLAATLTRFDPVTAGRTDPAVLVEQIHRLALLRIDRRGDSAQPDEHGEHAHGGQILVHRLLQAMIRAQMSPAELLDIRHEIHRVLARARPDGEVDDPDTWPRFRLLWPHIEATEAANCPDETVRRLMIDRVRYLWIRGDPDRGQERAERTEETWSALLGSTTDPREREPLLRQLLHLRFNHANIVRERGLFHQSYEMGVAVLGEQLALLGSGHPHTLMTAGGLAGDLRGLGRYQEALDRDHLTYASWLENFGENHPRTLTALSNLAVSYRLMGDFRAARERDEIVLARRKDLLGDSHPNTFLSTASLGRDLRDAGEYERSSVLLRGLVEAIATAIGAGSRAALNTMANLAASRRCAGDPDEAARLLDAAYGRLAASLGPTSPDTRACRLSRAVNLLAINEFEQARAELSAVRAAYEGSLGANHPHTLACATNLAMVVRATGDAAGALRMAEEAATGFRAVLGPMHPFTLDAATNVAICMAECGRFVAAHESLRDTAGKVVEVFGAHHPVTLRCQANLALLAAEPGGAGAETRDAAVLNALAERLGPRHSAVVNLRAGRLVHRMIDPHPF